jgi:hypothetical protein
VIRRRSRGGEPAGPPAILASWVPCCASSFYPSSSSAWWPGEGRTHKHSLKFNVCKQSIKSLLESTEKAINRTVHDEQAKYLYMPMNINMMETLENTVEFVREWCVLYGTLPSPIGRKNVRFCRPTLELIFLQHGRLHQRISINDCTTTNLVEHSTADLSAGQYRLTGCCRLATPLL